MALHDPGLDRLLDLDGFLAEIAEGYWAKIVARRVPADEIRPYGIAYALTLHDSDGNRVFGIDNAHLVCSKRGPAGRSSVWRGVKAVLKEAGIA